MLPEDASGRSHAAGSTEGYFVLPEESNYSFFPRGFPQILVVLMLPGGPFSALAGGDG